MGGFDNGTLQGGIFAQTKQFGVVLRGYGPPAPTAGLVGDLYLDVQTKLLYVKRTDNATDPWGNYIFEVPAEYADTLKWFTAAANPSNDFGVTGDYCIRWSGFSNYGTEPSVFGPKAAYGWPEIGEGPDTSLDAAYIGSTLPVGLSGEGDAEAFSSSTQLIVLGLEDEYILAIPVPLVAGTPVSQLGIPAGPVQVPMNLNPLYAAVNEHAV